MKNAFSVLKGEESGNYETKIGHVKIENFPRDGALVELSSSVGWPIGHGVKYNQMAFMLPKKKVKIAREQPEGGKIAREQP